ncbi:MAG: type II toxin-antitoxin system RelE/ParE family toxin [Candidatus Omnitrophica bacterium]|nr:type II toxin-antitoxin system RelE/ParE family toxin [Candidatus Omnitrophota bacterium]MBU1996555.1 type II toxin-antitoxin system RelE/ParE family toxin [Candidatus Omnitrophota bacterium]
MWRIRIHKLVLEEDLKKIPQKDRSKIIKTIYKKLSFSPKDYGSPLKYQLKGLWKLRIEDYRVVYRIEDKQILVLVLKVGMRRDEKVYKEMISRIKKI